MKHVDMLEIETRLDGAIETLEGVLSLLYDINVLLSECEPDKPVAEVKNPCIGCVDGWYADRNTNCYMFCKKWNSYNEYKLHKTPANG